MKKTLIYLTTLVTCLLLNAHAQELTQTKVLELPELLALDFNGAKPQVVATTSIIGDVIAQIGGDTINLTTLMNEGQDPHSFQPAARDLSHVSKADIIFVHGWNLEESLIKNLNAIADTTPLIPVAAYIEPLEFHSDSHHHDEHHDHEESSNEPDQQQGVADPHTWFSITNVKQWVTNIQEVLSTLNPDNAAIYEANANTYLAELSDLESYAETQLSIIPEDNRFLVSNHDSFAYFARDYNFELIGTIIPSLSSLAEPSANDLTDLIKELELHNVCTLFTEVSLSDKLAKTVAGELAHCEAVSILPLYTGAVGLKGSGADSYIGMFKSNVDTVVKGLKE